jgi:hypothetical protein
MSWYDMRGRRRYQRAVRRAFARVTFYREQCAAAGRLLTEPRPTPVAAIPRPPHTLCPFARPWSAEREPSLWTPTLWPLVRVLRMAGCRERLPVLEVREALLDRTRLPGLRPGSPYRVLLAPTATVAAGTRRAELEREALAVAEAAGAGWVVGDPAELAALPAAAGSRLRPVRRLPVAAVAGGVDATTPTVLYEPMLGYLGAVVPGCGSLHLDHRRVYARVRDGLVTLSLPGSRRPTLLDIVPAGAGTVTVGRCARHGVPTLVAAPAETRAPVTAGRRRAR